MLGILRSLTIGSAVATLLIVMPAIVADSSDGGITSGAQAQARSRRRGTHGHGQRHRGRHHAVVQSAAKTRYAYPLDFFMVSHPDFDKTPLSGDNAQILCDAFRNGSAGANHPLDLVRAGIVKYHPLRGGIFVRREPVKYIIMHSTESGVPQDAPHVIEGWSSMGRRHPGAQYVVDRDGTILMAVNPELGAVHVNIFKTLPGINNDNSVGIEMVHAGRQTYTPEQKEQVIRLVAYLQERYHVLNENIITHRYAQQGDHTDPVAFDWEGFLASKETFRSRAPGYVPPVRRDDEPFVYDSAVPTASLYIEMHEPVPDLSPDSPPAGSNPFVKTPANKLPAGASLRGEIEMDPASAGRLSSPAGQSNLQPAIQEVPFVPATEE